MGVSLGAIRGGQWNHGAAMRAFRLLSKLCFTPFFLCLEVTEVYQLKLTFPRLGLLLKGEVGLVLFFF